MLLWELLFLYLHVWSFYDVFKCSFGIPSKDTIAVYISMWLQNFFQTIVFLLICKTGCLYSCFWCFYQTLQLRYIHIQAFTFHTWIGLTQKPTLHIITTICISTWKTTWFIYYNLILRLLLSFLFLRIFRFIIF